MEFLRFGSSIPGSYWGCCAVDIIQNFKMEPDAPASIQLVSGDGGNPVMIDGEIAFAGPTYRDIFKQRIRFGTFDKRDMPNHAFLAVITSEQVAGSIGRKWLEILRETGFEFIRSVSNSVYQGDTLSSLQGPGSSLNYVFGLFRNIGNGAPSDPFTPPKAWTNLPRVTPEVWESIADPQVLAKEQHASQMVVWDKIGKPILMTEKQLEERKVPITLAGLRTKFPQQLKTQREQVKKALEAGAVTSGALFPNKNVQLIDPFAGVETPQAEEVYEEFDVEDYGDGCGPDCEVCYPQ